ncbi:FAD-linked oxidase-like protein [Amylocystis lapponica]|nr:FAD-linked oxidase-like protein [Amylocystis lapponica]
MRSGTGPDPLLALDGHVVLDPRPSAPSLGRSWSTCTAVHCSPYAFAFASFVSAALGYYFATSQDLLNSQYGSLADFQQAIAELREIFPAEDTVSTDPDDLHVHGSSENDYHPAFCCVLPQSTEDVVKIVKVANKYKMPITPYSGGTSLEGHFRSPIGGICLDMSRMDRVLEIHEADSDLVCQPGAQWMEINALLKKKAMNIYLQLDPGPGATIGGMISTGCSGTNAVRYGTAKAEWILNVTVVLPSGEVIKTRRRSRKSSAGFDTTKLFVGAEGTLGIITEATIRLAPLLPTAVAVVQFPDVRKATEAVTEVMNQGVGIQCVELCDDDFMRSTNIYGMSQRKWPEKDSLFFKFQGPTPRAIQETASIVKAITKKYGGTGFELAKTDKEAADLWQDRKNALYSGLALVPGCRGWSTDVCVPVSRLPDLVYETKKDMQESGITSTIVGHVGDGNFHALLLINSDEQLEIARGVVHRMVKRAIALDGTCTGEHGVGIGKRKYLIDELGEGTVELMKTVKRAMDPYNLFNPGKLYPDSKTTQPEKH